MVGKAKIDERAERPYLGIRTRTPMKGMSSVAGKLFKELSGWMKKNGVEPTGPPFLRYHVIDMTGEMDIEAGAPVAPDACRGDGRVTADVLPAGRYASLIYVGHGLTGNKALVEWAKAQGLEWDAWTNDKGHAFRCRCETYLTDPDVEPRKTKWEVEVAIRLADGAPAA